MKYALIIIVFIVIILGLVTCPQKNEISPDHYRVVRVVDGDTFIVSIDGEDVRVRLIGVDTPESVHPNKEVEHFALEASDYLKHLLTNESVFFGYDQSNAAANHKDRYGRLLAYAYRAGDSLFVNAEIIKQGYGFAYTSYPSVCGETRKIPGQYPTVWYGSIPGVTNITAKAAATRRMAQWQFPFLKRCQKDTKPVRYAIPKAACR